MACVIFVCFSCMLNNMQLGERAAHGQPTAHLGTVKNNPGLLDWIENVHVVLHTIAQK